MQGILISFSLSSIAPIPLPNNTYGNKNIKPNTKYGIIILLNFFHINSLYFIFSFTLKIKPDIRKNIGT